MMYGILGRCGRWCHNKAVGMLLLRVTLGGFFLAYGVLALQNLAEWKQFFGILGFPGWVSILVAVSEIAAGLALILGVFVWLAAPIIVVIMAVSIWKVTGPVPGALLMGFVRGWGTNLIYAAAALCVAFCGPGRYSLAAWFLRRGGMKAVPCRDCLVAHGIVHDCPDCPPEHSGMSATEEPSMEA